MTSPKISVVIPIFNTEQYLEKCLDSVINQSFKDIEIICVDDCSSDNSCKIVEQYKKNDNRISLINHEKNLGQGGARNTAILAAKADFIASVDSDDSMHIDMLKVLWESSNQGEFDITCCGYNRVDEAGKNIGKTIFQEREIRNVDSSINIFTLLNPAIWNKLWKKSLFIDNDIFFPNKLYYQDMATIPLLVESAKKIKIIDQSLYFYLVRQGSVTTTYSAKHIIDYFKVYEILFKYLQENHLIEEYSKYLVSYINEGMRFHSNNVVQSNMPAKEKHQYLRYLLMFKLSFLDNHDVLIEKSKDELLISLSKAESSKDIVSSATKLFGVDRSKAPRPKPFLRSIRSIFKDK